MGESSLIKHGVHSWVAQVFPYIHQQELQFVWFPAQNLRERAETNTLQSFIEHRHIIGAYLFLEYVSCYR
jgi:hypothetical protein